MSKTIEELEAELERMRKEMAGADDNDQGDTNDDDQEDDSEEDQSSEENTDEDNSEESEEELTEEAKKVAKLKASLDNLDKKLKAEAKARAEAEKKLKDAEIAKLIGEGKEKEALQAQMEQAQAELAELREENVSLKRDSVLDKALAGVEFRNDRSRAMARREIVENLTQGEDGSWMSKEGNSIDDYVAAYAQSEDNSFLFKQKTNRGSQTQPGSTPTTGTETPTSILDIPQDQFMKQMEKKLRGQGIR